MTRKVARLLFAMTLMTVTLAALAGGLDRWMILYCAGWTLYALSAMLSIDPDLIQERLHPPNPGADALPLKAVRLLALSHLVIGALDSGRWHLAPVPGSIRTAALIAMLTSSVVILRAMRANR